MDQARNSYCNGFHVVLIPAFQLSSSFILGNIKYTFVGLYDQYRVCATVIHSLSCANLDEDFEHMVATIACD